MSNIFNNKYLIEFPLTFIISNFQFQNYFYDWPIIENKKNQFFKISYFIA